MKNNCVVRIIKPSDQPVIPRLTPVLNISSINSAERIIRITAGSSVGIFAGILIVGMLKCLGMDFSGNEPYVIIGLPSVLCALTAFAIY